MSVWLGAASAQTAPVRPAPGAKPATAAPKAEPSPAEPAGGRGARPTGASVVGPRDLKYPAMHAIQFPKPLAFALANGMKVLLVEDHDLPLAQGAAMIRTGSAFDPAERIGLAQMAGIALRTGAPRSRPAIRLTLCWRIWVAGWIRRSAKLPARSDFPP